MKIVVLDGYTLNPGDLSWDALRQYGDVDIYERTPVKETVNRAKDANVILTNKAPLSAATLSQLPSLKYIGVVATGYNIIDIEKASEMGIVVCNAPGYGPDSVAQLTFALLLELCHRVQYHSDSVKQGKWSRSPDFSFWDYPLGELSGETMGIIGFGTIGKRVADIAYAFGMNILAFSRTQTDQSHRKKFSWVTIEELLQQSDVVSIHAPLVPGTNGLINKQTLKLMKPSAFILNTSRGQIIVDEDLADALMNGVIAGAAIDVLSVEPPPENNPLFEADNCIITPHIAWATKEARTRLMDITLKNLSAFLNGNPVNVINK